MAISCCIHDDLAGAGSWTAPTNSKGAARSESAFWERLWRVGLRGTRGQCALPLRLSRELRESLFQCRMSLKEGVCFQYNPLIGASAGLVRLGAGGPRDLALTNTRSDWEEIGRLWRYFAKRRIWGELRWLAPTNACK